MDYLISVFKCLVFLFLCACAAFAAPFIFLHAVNHWNDPEAFHSGATPDCPTWTPNN